MFGNRFFKLCLGLLLAGPAAALDADTINIDWVTVGDPGNTADTRVMNDGTTGYGAVGYSYLISKNEVTTGEYTTFLSAVAATDTHGLYNGSMWSSDYGCKIQQSGSSGGYTYSVAADYANRPVNYVSFWDAARFCNWLHNDQGTGDTENGAYTLTAEAIANNTITRNPGALFFLPSEDEWYKAAYYKGGGTSAGYNLYPTSSDTAPGYVNDDGDLSGTGTAFSDGVIDPGNYATYDGDAGTDGIGLPYYRTEVGEWENSASPYGTFDQGGNVWEWNETFVTSSSRGYRGGSFNNDAHWLKASSRNSIAPATEHRLIGFRVASIPEPGSIILLVSGLMAALIWWRRRK